MSAEPIPNAPSSIDWRTACCMIRRSGLPASPILCPMPSTRIVVAPTNDPKFTLAPCSSIASSHSPNVSKSVTPALLPAAWSCL